MNIFLDNVRQFRERLGISTDRFVDVIDLLRRLVIAKMIASFRSAKAGELASDVDAQWTPSTGELLFQPGLLELAAAGDHQARFTIAHEVAHVARQDKQRNRKVGGKAQFGQYIEHDEREADRFASALLAFPDFIDLNSGPTGAAVADMFGLPAKLAEEWLAQVANLPGRGMSKTKLPVKRFVIIDTGNYDDAMWAMSLNAERKNH